MSTPKVRTVACLGGVSLERDVPSEEISDTIREPGNLVWVDVQDPGPAELSMLLEEFRFHPLALEDVAKDRQRPKVDEYKGYVFAVTLPRVNPWASRRAARATCQVSAGLRTAEGSRLYDTCWLNVVRFTRGTLSPRNPSTARFSRCVSPCGPTDPPAARTDQKAETETAAPSKELLARCSPERRPFPSSRPRKAVLGLPTAEARGLAQSRHSVTYGVVAGGGTAEVRTVEVDLRILDTLDVEREMVAGVLDEYLSVISNRLSETMRTLTVVSVVAGTAGCVFGAWGMNIGGVPLAHTSMGFWGVFGGTTALITAALLVSRRRGWL